MRSTSRALTIDMATQPSTNGMSTKPAAVADIPLTCCRNSGTNEIAPNIAMPDRNPFTPAASTMRWRKSRNGMIGSRARRSTGTKAASATTALASGTRTSAPVEPEQLADGGHAEGHERAGPEPLQHPEADELAHVLRGARQRRAEQEQREPAEVDGTSAEEIREAAPERHRHRGGEQESREHPGVDVDATQALDDAGHRGGDDG